MTHHDTYSLRTAMRRELAAGRVTCEALSQRTGVTIERIRRFESRGDLSSAEARRARAA